MPSKNPQGSLLDILENIILARDFVAGYTFERFKEDRKTVYSAVRCLEIISEAARRLPDDLRQRHTHIPWRDVMDAGNIYRHDYDNVLETVIWKTIHKALEPLEKVVRDELVRLEPDKP